MQPLSFALPLPAGAGKQRLARVHRPNMLIEGGGLISRKAARTRRWLDHRFIDGPDGLGGSAPAFPSHLNVSA